MRAPDRLPRQPNARLLDLLRRQGRSVQWFARQMGTSRYAVYRVAGGAAGAPVDWYQRAAEILGVPIESISPEDDGSDQEPGVAAA